MSRYRLTIAHQHHRAEIAVRGDQFTCTIDHHTVTATILQFASPAYVIRLDDGRIISCGITTNGPITTVSRNGQSWPISVSEVYDELSLENRDDSTAAELRAPMPGRIVATPLAVGTAVKRGDPIVVIEAMKMQNALNAPASGTLKTMHVKPGDAVEAGQVLARIE